MEIKLYWAWATQKLQKLKNVLELDGGKGKFGETRTRLKTCHFTKKAVLNFSVPYINQ